LIRGEEDINKITLNINIQLDQMRRVLNNLEISSKPNVVIADWSFMQDDPRFCDLLASLATFVCDDVEVGQLLHQHCESIIRRINEVGGRDIDERTQLQKQYILEETALSLYMTEILDYKVEVYRRGMGFIDYLYSQRPAVLSQLVGNPSLNRRFVSIEDWIRGQESGQ
jgi:hypothetical protein